MLNDFTYIIYHKLKLTPGIKYSTLRIISYICIVVMITIVKAFGASYNMEDIIILIKRSYQV